MKQNPFNSSIELMYSGGGGPCITFLVGTYSVIIQMSLGFTRCFRKIALWGYFLEKYNFQVIFMAKHSTYLITFTNEKRGHCGGLEIEKNSSESLHL